MQPEIQSAFSTGRSRPDAASLAQDMSELQVIQSALHRAAGRRRWARALRGLWLGLLLGAILSVLVLGAYHLFPLPLWTLVAAALVPFPCLFIGLILAGWRKPALAQVARWVDDRQQLKERVSTALEVSVQQTPDAWRDLVLTDAAEHVKGLDPRRLIPYRLTKASRWALVVLALGAGLGFVPEYRSKSYLQKKADQQVIKEAGRQIVELTQHSLEKRQPALEAQKSMEAVTSLGQQLEKQTLTRSEALRDLANAADRLKNELKEMARDPALNRLEAARNATGNDAQPGSGLQKQIESLQKQLGTPIGNPDALEKLQKQLDQLQEAAKGMADRNSSGAGAQAEREKLSQSLSELSRQAQSLGLQLPELDAAIDALAANQTQLFLKDLEQATTDLGRMREMAKTLQQLQQQMDKLGKDLAEQLKLGQPELALQTLQKMIDQLNSANPSSERLQQIQNDVSQAVAPAANYGQTGEHLKNATQQIQAGNRPGAAQSLAAAAKELEKLMQQMGDADQLADTLAALNQATMMIGSGQRWGAGNRAGLGPPRAGPGGQPGSGVGTWADENATWDGRLTGGWDNSGVVRPDIDSRGQSDRGDGELSDALKPDKVKGQFSPGNAMPSITLKNVSIKGESGVQFREAATAAQSDAQSALSQDKVPRAYQSAVREYFDDLRK
jgi:hypothetical protein